jgi:hypothetical protein
LESYLVAETFLLVKTIPSDTPSALVLLVSTCALSSIGHAPSPPQILLRSAVLSRLRAHLASFTISIRTFIIYAITINITSNSTATATISTALLRISRSNQEHFGNAVSKLVKDVGRRAILAFLGDLVVIYAERNRKYAYSIDLYLITLALSDQHAVFSALIHLQR